MAPGDLAAIAPIANSWEEPLARLEERLDGLEIEACADLEVELITGVLTVEEAVDLARTLSELGMALEAESVVDAVATVCRAANGWFRSEMVAAVA